MTQLRNYCKSVFIIILSFLAYNAFCFEPQVTDEQERLAQELFREVLCVVCEGQSIATSDHDVAKDMRDLIKRKIIQGQSKEVIELFLTSRYGDQIITRPPVNHTTYLLWSGPFMILICGLLLLMGYTKSLNKRQDPL